MGLGVADPDLATLSRHPIDPIFVDGQLEFGRQIGNQRNEPGVGWSFNRQSHSAPGQHDHGDHGGEAHDLQGFAARFMNADQVVAEEIQRNADGDEDRAVLLDGAARVPGSVMPQLGSTRAINSRNQPVRYWPADTELIGPVRT